MIHLELAGREQGPALIKLDAQASHWPWPDTALDRHLNQQHVLSAFAEDVLVGFLVAQSVLDETSLLHLVVGREHQGQGFGAAILTIWLKQLSLLGQGRCLLEVRKSNAPAVSLYRKMGFTEIGRRPGYYATESGAETAIVMALALDETGTVANQP